MKTLTSTIASSPVTAVFDEHRSEVHLHGDLSRQGRIGMAHISVHLRKFFQESGLLDADHDVDDY